MQFFGKRAAVILGTGLAFGLMYALPGCDSSGAKTDYKPVESNILKKLGSSSQAQGDAARAKMPPRVKERVDAAKAKR